MLDEIINHSRMVSFKFIAWPFEIINLPRLAAIKCSIPILRVMKVDAKLFDVAAFICGQALCHNTCHCLDTVQNCKDVFVRPVVGCYPGALLTVLIAIAAGSNDNVLHRCTTESTLLRRSSDLFVVKCSDDIELCVLLFEDWRGIDVATKKDRLFFIRI